MKVAYYLLACVCACMLAACGTGASVVVPDLSTAEDGSADVPVGDVPAPDSAGCAALCGPGVCGTVGICDCGGCEAGQQCNDLNQCEAVPPECADQCKAAGAECGCLDPEACTCDCGECNGGEECAGNQCVGIPPPEEEPFDVADVQETVDEVVPEVVPETTPELPPTCEEICLAASAVCGTVGDCDCGSCGDGFECQDGACVELPPDCNVVCGDNGCGPIDGCECGDCTWGDCMESQCVCMPNCAGKMCGADGCGSQCGACPVATPVCAWDLKCYASCDPSKVGFSDKVQKIVVLATGKDGTAGEALDVDGNPKTCAPFGKCKDGLDNQMATMFEALAQFTDINVQISKSVEDGSLLMLFESVGYNEQGMTFDTNVYFGEPAVPKASCNFQSAVCNYLVAPESFDLAACKPLIYFDNTKVKNGSLSAGGKKYKIIIVLPIVPSSPFTMELLNARMVATVGTGAGGQMSLSGVLAGAISKKALLAQVDTLPDVGLPVSKDTIKMFIDAMLSPDIDSDGDGKKDAASIGFKLSTNAGKITGLSK